jgi:hypothetical protein
MTKPLYVYPEDGVANSPMLRVLLKPELSPPLALEDEEC